ncbi:hypothetical protein ACHAWO_010665 [Cyclotella atomus]|uniref:Uncharacterized protein n=1 Tax=Cyclotella atomus TaxID=382360 RepID=A0ABD3QAJ3_9STRA
MADVPNPADSLADDEVVAPPQPQLPSSIQSVWDHPLVEMIQEPLPAGSVAKQKVSWKCLAPGCGKQWNGANSSKALAHGSRDPDYCLQLHVQACKGTASREAIDLFCSLIQKRARKKTATKRANDIISEDLAASAAIVSDAIQEKKKSRQGSQGFASANPDLSRKAENGRQLDVQSSFEKGTISGCNSADLDSAIAQLVYCKGLPFSFAECPYFKRMLEIARCAPRGYQPPKKGILGGEMLDLAYKAQLGRDMEKLLIDSEIYGLSFFGDGATIRKCPLVNIFASALNSPAVLIEIVDCTARLLEGEKKDGAFISSLFLPVMEALDKLKDKADIVFFDGGSNFQLAGRIIQARFPRITVVHGLEHVLSLVFEDISKISVIRVSLV